MPVIKRYVLRPTMVEHRVHIAGVTGSSPVSTTNILGRLVGDFFINATERGASHAPKARLLTRYFRPLWHRLLPPFAHTVFPHLGRARGCHPRSLRPINGHAHAFFMDNRCWSGTDAYWMDLGGRRLGMGGRGRRTPHQRIHTGRPGAGGSRSSSSLILAKTGASSASPCARWGTATTSGCCVPRAEPPKQYAPPGGWDDGEDGT